MNNITDFDLKKGVFISYSRRYGSSAARSIFQALKPLGFNVFFDVEDVSPGRFTEVILNQLGMRDHFIVVISPQTIDVLCDNSSWPRQEVERAFELQKNIIPVLVDGAQPIRENSNDKFLSRLGTLNQLEVPHQFFDAAMNKLSSEFLRQPTLQELQIKIGEEHYEAACEAIENKDWRKAVEEISMGIKRSPNRPDYYLLRSVAKNRLYKDEEAISDIDAALALDPSSSELADVKYNLLQGMNKLKESLDFISGWQKRYGS